MRCDAPSCWNKAHHDVETQIFEGVMGKRSVGLCCVCWHRFNDYLREKPHATSVRIDKALTDLGEERAFALADRLMHMHLDPIPEKEFWAIFGRDTDMPIVGFSARWDRVVRELKEAEGPDAKRWLHLLTNANPPEGE
jgi:hypothetical protein